MDKLKRALIKEEVYAITNDTKEALILNQMLYWSERREDFDKFIEEEKDLSTKFSMDQSQELDDDTVEKLKGNGWIYKKTCELKDELMLTDSEVTIRRKIQSLVKKGYLEERNNPKIKYDRTLQYRVNLNKIVLDMFNKGYILQDYKINVKELLDNMIQQHSEASKLQNEESKVQIEALKQQNEFLKQQVEAFKQQKVGAIPKTTTKTDSKTTPYDKPSAFTNYKQRKYDGTDGSPPMSDLERKLLGWD